MKSKTILPEQTRANPYIGPREFRRREKLPNRATEARELRDLIIAERVVVLHAPSGAGKTSLIEAGVVRLLEEENFAPTPRLRVNQPPPEDDTVGANRYVYSLASYLYADTPLTPDSDADLIHTVRRWVQFRSAPRPVLVIDQFEEILTLDPCDDPGREDFFSQLGELVTQDDVWILLAMREDYVGGLYRLMRMPGLFYSRYRLGFLSFSDAADAVTQPAEEHGVTFSEEAVGELLKFLSITKVQRPRQPLPDHVRAPYVVPFHLQVVCHRLWDELTPSKDDHITTKCIERYAGDGRDLVDRALINYYSETVEKVAEVTGTDEGAIRRWFETKLITKQQFRSQTQEMPAVKHPEKAIEGLMAAYLVESCPRSESGWYELTHDRLIAPVRESNATWRQRLDPWRAAAWKWKDDGKPDEGLMPRDQLHLLPIRLSNLSKPEAEFVKRSLAQADRNRYVARIRTAVVLLSLLAIVEAIALVVFAILRGVR